MSKDLCINGGGYTRYVDLDELWAITNFPQVDLYNDIASM